MYIKCADINNARIILSFSHFYMNEKCTIESFIVCTYLSFFSITRVYYLFLVFALSGSSKSFERNIEMVSKVSFSHRMAFDARGQSFRVSAMLNVKRYH